MKRKSFLFLSLCFIFVSCNSDFISELENVNFKLSDQPNDEDI